MFKRLVAMVLLLFLILSLFPLAAFADNRDLIVYYAVGSKSAYCYHARSNCPSLSRSTVGEITLEKAVARGLSPCSRCHPPAPETRSNSSSNKSSSFTVTEPFIEAILWILFGLGAAFFWLKGKIEERKRKKERAAAEKKRQQEWEEARPKYLAEYGQKPIAELCRMPEDCYIKDGLPACRHGDGTWGEDYTFYVTYRGKCYHRAGCFLIDNRYAKEINACQLGRYERCSGCFPDLPDLSWYNEYKRILHIRWEYKIDEPK